MPKENSGDDVFSEAGSSEESIDDISWDDVSDALQDEKTEVSTGVTGAGAADAKKHAEFSELQKTGVVTAPQNLDFILDIPLEVTVELGRTTMAIYDLLQMGQGSIIELSKLAGEPLEILVNKKLIARGEVVVVNEKFGIRLTDIVSPQERVENLG